MQPQGRAAARAIAQRNPSLAIFLAICMRSRTFNTLSAADWVSPAESLLPPPPPLPACRLGLLPQLPVRYDAHPLPAARPQVPKGGGLQRRGPRSLPGRGEAGHGAAGQHPQARPDARAGAVSRPRGARRRGADPAASPFNPESTLQVVWLENTKVRRYPIDSRGALQSPDPATWQAALRQYLADLECPLSPDSAGQPALLQWLLLHAGEAERGGMQGRRGGWQGQG